MKPEWNFKPVRRFLVEPGAVNLPAPLPPYQQFPPADLMVRIDGKQTPMYSQSTMIEYWKKGRNG